MTGRTTCGAKKRGGPGYCGQAAGWGTTHPGVGHCKLHGGSTPNQRTKADNDLLDQELQTLLKRQELVPLDNPLQRLQLFAAEVCMWQEILGDKVELLRTWSYDDISEKEEVRAIILAYERAMDRTGKILVDMARLDIEERLVRLSQAQAAVLIRIIETVLESREMDLPREKRQLGRSIVAREVQAVVAVDPAANGAALVPS